MIVAVSDLHLGSGKNLGPDRYRDAIDPLEQAIEYACRKRVKYFVLLGDSFDYPNPSNFLREGLLYSLRRLWDYKIFTYILIGNHEFANKCHSFSGFNFLEPEGLYVVSEPYRFSDNKYADFVFLPHNKEIDSKSTTWTKIFKKFRKKETDKPKIVLGHFPVIGSKTGPSDFIMSSQVEKSELKKLNADLILLGDIHKPQKLFDRCYYVGSIDRINFGEQDEKKRFIHVTKKLKVRSIELINRNLITFIVGKDKYKIVDNAIVKPVINCNEVDVNKFDTSLILKKLKDSNAVHILPFQWNIDPKERRKKSKKNEGKIDKRKYLRKFLKRNYPKANVDRLMKIYEIVKTKS